MATGVITAATLIADLDRQADTSCVACGQSLCGHQLLIAIVAGFKREPRCPECAASALGRDAAGLQRHVVQYIQHRDCYRGAWRWTTEREGPCKAVVEERAMPHANATEEPPMGAPEADVAWDAGEMGCGDLVLELRRRLHEMRPGQVLAVLARDPGAPEDIPAWCRMTGHVLVFARHPEYAIERRGT